jgi:hypothetical protein
MPRIAECGWQPRWQPEPAADGSAAGAWSSDDYATFHTDGTVAGERWLRYHHLAPLPWRDADRQEKPTLTPQLITDFTAYDTVQEPRHSESAPQADSLGIHWVGDLALSCTAAVESEKGNLLFELRKGGRRFLCRLDVATGRAALSISGQDMAQCRPTTATAIRGPGSHEIRFSNCDNELHLWVDGKVASFDAPTTYKDLGNTQPDEADLAPVGVGTDGAKVRIHHLRILRDLYYGAVRGTGAPKENCDVQYMPDRALPGQGSTLSGLQHIDFPLGPDRFFVLGDNSTCSKDGRLWGADNYWVPRELLLGKALFRYWPHSWDKIPYVNVPMPYFPNFARMGLVR